MIAEIDAHLGGRLLAVRIFDDNHISDEYRPARVFGMCALNLGFRPNHAFPIADKISS